jgi:hypothetical protein
MDRTEVFSVTDVLAEAGVNVHEIVRRPCSIKFLNLKQASLA